MPMTKFVQPEPLDRYRERFAEHASLERTDGVLTVRMHTRGEEARWGLELHNALPQLFEVIGADRENELMILTGTGDHWLREHDASSFDTIEDDDEKFKYESYEYWYRDGLKLQENILWDIDFPTIAAINGPGFHTEFALLCDLTICTEDTRFIEPHLEVGLAPGDGQFLVFQELLGLKRANYAMYTTQSISAQEALELGLVNEVVPRERLMDRANELAAMIMQNDPVIRRLTTHIIRRPWRRLFTDDFGMHFGYEMWGALVKKKKHSSIDIHEVVDRGA